MTSVTASSSIISAFSISISFDSSSVYSVSYSQYSSTAVSVPATYSALDVTPAGSVELTAGTAAAASYDKVSSVAMVLLGCCQNIKKDTNIYIYI